MLFKHKVNMNEFVGRQEDRPLKLADLILIGPTKTGASNLQFDIKAEID